MASMTVARNEPSAGSTTAGGRMSFQLGSGGRAMGSEASWHEGIMGTKDAA